MTTGLTVRWMRISADRAGSAPARAGLAAEPGSTYSYSGLGHMLAGRIAEVVTGQEFGALVREQLLKPIGASTAVVSRFSHVAPRADAHDV